MDQGYITIDGINVKQLDPSWLRGQAIGYINQVHVLLFPQWECTRGGRGAYLYCGRVNQGESFSTPKC